MDIETFRDFCLSLKGTTEDLKWGDNLCFMVEGKIFVIASLDSGGLALKCDPDHFDALVSRDGISQGYHLAKRHWISLENLEVTSDNELKKLINTSRALVISKLSKKLQQQYSVGA
ncbi:MmcQ/YjbR family DNA-binding protein [Pedobacter metabolipauper]|uniref:Putative DNA-binding protein (MmcQ/YjbR family) n=1 Tax=Pedobacter metabolipauper TaxID=425513 RepID=A0A4R6SQ82_9SPHI|nr:MmcQ/YjbR family DNA-binding protein [Pedobacter metabolipauper]TDQ06911.1 putative DNA-binding protein (MmcQ/YjbR family) [Pedobacter metabolipauper]